MIDRPSLLDFLMGLAGVATSGRPDAHVCPGVHELMYAWERTHVLPECRTCRDTVEVLSGEPATGFANGQQRTFETLKNFTAKAIPLASECNRIEVSWVLGSSWEEGESAVLPWFNFLNQATGLEVCRYVVCPDTLSVDAEDQRLKRLVKPRNGYQVKYVWAKELGQSFVRDVAIFCMRSGQAVVQDSSGDPFVAEFSTMSLSTAKVNEAMVAMRELARPASTLRDFCR